MTKVIGAICLAFLVGSFAFSAKARDVQVGGKEARLDRFSICPGTENSPVSYKVNSIKTSGNKMLIDSILTVKEDINYDMIMVVQLQRCKSKESLDTCENFHSFTLKNYCNAIETQEMWKRYYASYEPKWKCPLKKGIYRAKASEFDVSAFLLFPVNAWFYKMKGELRNANTGKVVLCTIAEAKVVFKGA